MFVLCYQNAKTTTKGLVPNNFVVQKIIDQGKFWVQRYFGSEEILGKNRGPKNDGSNNIFGKKKFLSKKYWVQNNFSSKFFQSKKCCSEKM